MNILAMGTEDVRDEIYKFCAENPALEIVKDNVSTRREGTSLRNGDLRTTENQRALEATEDKTETLQAHLMHQLNSMNLSYDEMELSQKLIYNLDSNGFYGNMLAPESLINKTRPLQTKEMLNRCIRNIQSMDPVGTCCRSPEESLFVQAQLSEDAPQIALFILDGHIELLNPPEPAVVLKKLKEYEKNWHKKQFATEILLDRIEYDEADVKAAINFILHLNIHPAQNYLKDTNAEYEKPDVVLKVIKKEGKELVDDYSRGIVAADSNHYFQVMYASGALPELRLSQEFSIDKENFQKAKNFLEILAFRESSLILQGCAVVNAQKDFFLKGDGHLNVLTRRQIASELGIHESTVSRMASRHSSKYIQTEWGMFPISYFFNSGVNKSDGSEKISSEVVKGKIISILTEHNVSDSKLTEMLNAEGIKIARRTVAKYRSQLGLANSYKR